LKKERLLTFDFLKAIAIILIILSHLHDFIPGNQFWLVLAPYFAMFGLGLFVFTSGYLISYTNETFQSINQVLDFYKRRITRIYPLYWVALLINIVTFSIYVPLFDPRFNYMVTVNPGDYQSLIIHLLGLQVLLSPAFVDSVVFWFVGFILICYLLYPIFAFISQDLKKIVLLTLLICFIFSILNLKFHVIGYAIFEYFLLFVIGIICFKKKFIGNKIYIKYIIASIPFLFIIIYLYNNEIFKIFSFFSNFQYGLIQLLLFNLIVILGTIIASEVSEKLVKSQFIFNFKNYIEAISSASYCAYLFQGIILILISGLTQYFGISPIFHQIIIIGFTIPIIIIFSYYLQMLEFSIIKKLTKTN
jgi:peptidoglycan/LPS O-acetylase OafA/YrhL